MTPEACRHFVELARIGTLRTATCSDGETRAAKLADAILEHASGLDEKAAEGLKAFIDIARQQPRYAVALLLS